MRTVFRIAQRLALTGPERPQHASRAIFNDMIGRNREPADVVPYAPNQGRVWFGDSYPVQLFPFGAIGGRINDPAVIAASRKSVPGRSLWHFRSLSRSISSGRPRRVRRRLRWERYSPMRWRRVGGVGQRNGVPGHANVYWIAEKGGTGNSRILDCNRDQIGMGVKVVTQIPSRKDDFGSGGWAHGKHRLQNSSVLAVA